MQTSPPPFQGGAPAKSNSKIILWVSLAAVLLVVFLCGGLVWAAYSMVTGVGKSIGTVAQCPMTFELVSEATKAYAQENGGKLPPAKTWQKDIAPYYSKLAAKLEKQMEDVPFLKIKPQAITTPLSCTMGTPAPAIAYNSEVAGKKLTEIKDPNSTVLFFEKLGTPAMNLAAAYKDTGEKAKLFGEPRDLLKVYVEGNKNPFASEKSEASFDINWKDALEKGGAGQPAPAEGGAPALPAEGAKGSGSGSGQ